ncbi:pyridoxamine 5'-phosphate oxidase family protein [Microbacterium atlanticum]|uniref:pyridoxamine 5'-phosphate oxidase family protein n=1 Tax=Microbacterium atlanticum TaxID=2782168 RepID=UPI00188730A4|nr:pyridoxamine 5'-phosphate oxidase family protein [Microbacterium atlanticum]
MTANLELDPNNLLHARVLARLENDRIAWLGTNGRQGYPHSVPVWFAWWRGQAVILVHPGTAKERNLRSDPRASLHLETGQNEQEFILLRGSAEISAERTATWMDRIRGNYRHKYGDDVIAAVGDGGDSLIVTFRPRWLTAA